MTTTRLEATCAAIGPADEAVAQAVRDRLDAKTKPPGSLGRLEDLAVQLAAIAGTADPPIPDRAIVVLTADHGVAAEGVSAYPQAVTGQMVRNFAAGGAAINVLARRAGAELVVADLGVVDDPGPLPGVRSHRLGPGTANFADGPAMSREQAVAALEFGIGLADELAGSHGVLGVGEMGIANTTSASALTAALTGAPIAQVVGRGTGIDDDRLAHKRAVVARGLAVNRPDPDDPLDVLAKLGGFEIAGLAGVMLGAAARRVPVLLDGFITAAAALVAVRICPAVGDSLIAAHQSAEPGHAVLHRLLALRPLLDLDLRLGEATGAALALLLADAALHILHEMATFDSARVSRGEGRERQEED